MHLFHISRISTLLHSSHIMTNLLWNIAYEQAKHLKCSMLFCMLHYSLLTYKTAVSMSAHCKCPYRPSGFHVCLLRLPPVLSNAVITLVDILCIHQMHFENVVHQRTFFPSLHGNPPLASVCITTLLHQEISVYILYM